MTEKEPVGYLDRQVDKHCKNLLDSYGEICVQCNCCGRFDPDSMYTDRLRVLRRQLKEDQAKLTKRGFQTALQQRNIRTDIRRFQRQITYYEWRVVGVKP